MAFLYRGDQGWILEGDGMTYGAAQIPGLLPRDRALRVIFIGPDPKNPQQDRDLFEKYPWEHVSVSTQTGIPTWLEMSRIKRLFWDDEDRVVQFHPPKSEYVNMHPHCLHLWRWTGGEFPHPPMELVGYKKKGTQ